MPANPVPFSALSRRALLRAMAAAAVAGNAPAFAQSAPRIVSLDYGLASTLLSLGIVPLAVSDLADWDKWVVEPAMPKSAVNLGSSWEVNFELLVALKPDIILTTPYLDELLPKLKQVAKVVRLEIYKPGIGPILPAAIAATRKLGAAIGREAEAEGFLARADAFFTDRHARLSAKSPPPVALVNFMDARHARIYASPGLYHNVLERIGVRNAWTEESNYWGFQTIAIEELSRVADPDARLIAFEPIPADVLSKIMESPLWQSLPFARPGRLSILPPALMFGMVNEAMRFGRLLTDLLDPKA
ncbi:iron-siderophore ABC transporter substrate-binding protein [Rhizobium mayense]|uniref:Iron-siderophore ABC transporter substrate-binding protein n=1 Tax=Rhizobium mayense TaxID=1312184 RepID=A0ABT7JPM4_9HYPH|nr:iron-siderophore ABC transporter substrate-binding protein [Rhizobium mayense]MDL2398304.1 iron-siderophore ABC transporter substrate-binding protein [Rhizobium mayense]